ncbi:MAG: hypothetical protein Q9191_006303 [Dirinaria sp. TL-2023a]
MAAPPSAYQNRHFLAVIGDEDSVTGLLLAGIGVSSVPVEHAFPGIQRLKLGAKHVTQPPDAQKNFLVVDAKTETSTIEQAFDNYTQDRNDIAILLINQHIAERIRHRVDTYTDAFPAVLEIPSKDHPYDPEKDSVLRRVRRLFGE